MTINKNPTSINPVVAGLTAQITANAILDSIGFNYVTMPALSNLLDAILLKLPLQYLSQSEQDKLSQAIAKRLSDEFSNYGITKDNIGKFGVGFILGIGLSSTEDAVSASLQGQVPPVVISLTQYALDTTGNAAIFLATNPELMKDPVLGIKVAAAVGITEGATDQILAAAKSYVQWNIDMNANLQQVSNLEAQADNLHALAEQAKAAGYRKSYQQLMKIAISLDQAASTLATNASGYQQGNPINAIWQSLWTP